MVMDHFQTIYTQKAAEYHQIIAAEEVDGNLVQIQLSTL
jgi:hypothetical protein